ncbi:OmpA family protein [Salinisphaera sp. P385]|uniref:OmpA family protein n=1 Tax=Spectribacter acetivorans TaxID=3075603 RepID=A0ABU3B923_9GAMM|nr:OmpA family protein [Salinisphaera sp. P385]MDT0617773.1 OmpA family protein [Salinisphaera sp. P385]
MIRFSLIALLAASVFAAGCAGDPNRRTKAGAGVGAVLGGLIGSEVGDESNSNIAAGAVLGALAGGAVGRYMDNQHAELQERLAAEQAREELYITRMGGDTLRVGVASDASFEVDSAELNFEAQSTFDKIANVFKDYEKTAVHLVGHTDSSGSDSYNQKLSERRASAVASYLSSKGVNSSRMATWGRGESEPIATNDTEAGRSRNRRVDIVIKPIVEGQEKAAFSAPPYLGS